MHFLTKGGAGVTWKLIHHGGAGFGHVGTRCQGLTSWGGGAAQTHWAGTSTTSCSMGPAGLTEPPRPNLQKLK